MSNLLFNPVTGEFNLTGEGGGGSGSSAFLQQASFSSSSSHSTTTQLSADFVTLPTSSDGASFGTISITPSTSSSQLLIQGSVTLSALNTDAAMIAIFDGISTSPQAVYYQALISATQIINLNFSFYYTPASLSALTFDIRFGGVNNSGSPLVCINANAATGSSVAIGDSSNFSTVTITEISPTTARPFAVTITGNDDLPQTGTNFDIVGINGFQFLWNSGDSQFQITPDNSFIWGTNIISLTLSSLVAGNSNILVNPFDITVELPANAGTIVGDIIEIVGLAGGYTIAQAANQQVFIGEEETTGGAGGSIACTSSSRSSISLRCVSTQGGTYTWGCVVAPQGNFTVI